MKLIGIDDAGRGPVLGPMVLSGVMVDDESEEKVLQEMGAKDSKLIYPNKRKKLADEIVKTYAFHTEVVSPKEIDDFPNLNNLEALKCGIVINTLLKDIDEKVKVIVDCPSVNVEAWTDTLLSAIIKKDLVDLHCLHKADLKYPVVSAASIVAKEAREAEIKALKKKLGVNFGSGYPSDPKTKDFLVKTYGDTKYDTLIRKSWSTYKKVREKFGQQKLYYL